MKKQSIKKRIFNFSTFITSLITVPLLLFVTYQLLVARDQLYELQLTHDKKIEKYEKENKFYSNLLNDIFGETIKMENFTSLEVDMTGYSAEARQCDKDPHIVANGDLSQVGMLAMSRDLPKYGIHHDKRVYIPRRGVLTVADTMNVRFNKRLDLMMGNRQAALKFGLKENVKVYYFKG